MCLLKNSADTPFSLKAGSYQNVGYDWTADDQCKIFYGNNASFCHVILILSNQSFYKAIRLIEK